MTFTEQVSSNLKDISSGAKWRGHLDRQANGALHGWAFLASDPHAPLELDLYIYGVHVATTFTSIGRADIDRALGLAMSADTGFRFDMKAFRPEGALELLRKMECTLSEVSIKDGLYICIAGTQHRLPGRQSLAQEYFDLSPFRSGLVQAAGAQLRQSIAAGADITQLGTYDHQILLMGNPLFSEDWYRETYGEVELSGLEPVEHYARLFSILERSPGPWFDTAGYLSALPEGQKLHLPPVVDYDIHGHDSWWPGQGRFRIALSQEQAQSDYSDYAVLIHLYHLDTVPDLQRIIANFPNDIDIIISIPEESPDYDPEVIASLFPRVRDILMVPSRGQDVAAFLEAVRRLKGRGYRFFCKAHSKKGNKYPETWRQVMFDALAGSPERVSQTVELFRSNPRVLMAGPEQFWLSGANFGIGSDSHLEELTSRIGLGSGALCGDWAFFADTCFWIDAELAALVAEAVTANDIADVDATEKQTVHAVECLFSLVATAVGGKVALIDGCDWLASPTIPEADAKPGLQGLPGESASHFLARHLRALTEPQIGEGTAQRPRGVDPEDIFGGIDTALHGAIDVLVSCWNGRPELLHHGLGDLGRQLERQGLTWSALVTSPDVQDVFYAASCRNVVMDSLYLRFPAACTAPRRQETGTELLKDAALSLLRSEHMFLKTDLPKGQDLHAALSNIRKLYAYWREILIRHKVRIFLIWGNTAPKSRLFIHLCRDLGIEYQIIERGHFPGTLSIDPLGQFGTGVQPRLITHVSPAAEPSENVDARFAAIRSWYDAQQDHAAYAKFQKRGTRDLQIMRQARALGRPVILVVGGNDQGGGVVGPDPDPLRVNWFESSDKAFTLIRRLVAAKFPNTLVVLRPHPSQAPQDGEFVLVARETALDDLIEESDLCITIATTASAICLLKDKPLITLGLSELNGQGVGTSVADETHLLAVLRQNIWSDFADTYPKGVNRSFIVNLFDRHLIGINGSVPTRHHITDLARLLAGRVQRMKTGFLKDYEGQEEKISQAMFEDVRDRGRAIFPVFRGAFDQDGRPQVSVVLPIYGDYEGTRICFDQLVRHQKENGYRVITVWDRGPDLRLRDLCLEYAERAGFTYLENHENVGFSGTVNSGILHAGRDDVILLNSDTVPCGNWALRLQDAAYAHPKIASVVPFSNNATIYSVPFPNGAELPAAGAVNWVEALDREAQGTAPHVVEMPISHGFCTFIRRSTFDRLGLFSESKFDKGHGEDNEFSMRCRAAGYFCGCATHVFVGHAGSTSFAEDATKWKLAGRGMMQNEFSHYFEEIRDFFRNDPLSDLRKRIAA